MGAMSVQLAGNSVALTYCHIKFKIKYLLVLEHIHHAFAKNHIDTLKTEMNVSNAQEI